MMLSLRTFYALIARDMRVFKSVYMSRLINAMIIVILETTVFQYIMPSMGVVVGYGALMVAGCVATNGLFDILGNSSRLVSDIEGDKTIGYDLTLPLPHSLVMLRLAVTNALQSMAICIWILPVSKLLMGSGLSFEQTVWYKVVALFLIAHIFYGFLALFVATCLKNLWGVEHIWVRFIFPFWWLGGFSFTWKTLQGISPMAAYVGLLNPLTMCFEGMRGAILGQEGYLPFWFCFLTLVLWTVVIGYVGTKRMMRRLDCVS